MEHEIELQEHSIVAVGALNPAIFQPAWFAAESLITPAEAKAARVQVISPQATAFQMDWFTVQVLQNQLSLATENEAFYRHLVDLVAASFSRLIHTPVTALGINYRCHFRLASAEDWQHLSNELTPKHRWSKLLESPDMRSLTMAGPRAEGPKGHLQITLEPSVRVQHGIFVAINNHYDMSEDDVGCRGMLSTLDAEWDKTYAGYKDVLRRMFPDD